MSTIIEKYGKDMVELWDPDRGTHQVVDPGSHEAVRAAASAVLRDLEAEGGRLMESLRSENISAAHQDGAASVVLRAARLVEEMKSLAERARRESDLAKIGMMLGKDRPATVAPSGRDEGEVRHG